MVYYSENDPKAAAWLRELCKENLIAPGEVDERDIRDVRPTDLRGYSQCHFFAGIGGWSYALRLAGWPDDRPAWTGSCPCQPFSAAGKGKGFADERHLWPDWFWLISQCNPVTLFGEQVAGKAGRAWLDLVFADLESLGYTCGQTELCAAGIGAPHIRQRTYWVADSQLRAPERPGLEVGSTSGTLEAAEEERERVRAESWHGGKPSELADSDSREEQPAPERRLPPGSSQDSELGDASDLRCVRLGGEQLSSPQEEGRLLKAEGSSFWEPCEWVYCRDGKYRPVEPGTFPLAHGVPNRLVKLRGLGNAIVPHLAAEFIKAAGDG